MAHKVHPFSFRLGEIFDWKSRWFNIQKYKQYLKQDTALRDFIVKKLRRKAGLESVEIERTANRVRVLIKASKPGMIIGRGGSGAEELKNDLLNKIKKYSDKGSKINLTVDIEEVSRNSVSAQLAAEGIAEQIEKRIPFRRAIKQAISKAMINKEVKGIKVAVSGRLNGSEIARTEWLKEGNIPLQTIRADIDYAKETAFCTYGTIGIKVWVFKGEIFKENKPAKKP